MAEARERLREAEEAEMTLAEANQQVAHLHAPETQGWNSTTWEQMESEEGSRSEHVW